MITDETRQRIVLFGGLSSDQVGSGLAGTWEWDGGNWTQVTTANASARDPSRRTIVLYGGPDSQTWVFGQ